MTATDRGEREAGPRRRESRRPSPSPRRGSDQPAPGQPQRTCRSHSAIGTRTSRSSRTTSRSSKGSSGRRTAGPVRGLSRRRGRRRPLAPSERRGDGLAAVDDRDDTAAASRAPTSTSATIAAGILTARVVGRDNVRSARRVAISPICGRFDRSRSPPQPNTVDRRFDAVDRITD